MTSLTAQYTDFSKRNVLGKIRLQRSRREALGSTSGRPDAKPFDIVIVGGGSFGKEHLPSICSTATSSAATGFSSLKQDLSSLPSILRTCRRLALWRPAQHRQIPVFPARRYGDYLGGLMCRRAFRGLPIVLEGARCFAGRHGLRNFLTPKCLLTAGQPKSFRT